MECIKLVASTHFTVGWMFLPEFVMWCVVRRVDGMGCDRVLHFSNCFLVALSDDFLVIANANNYIAAVCRCTCKHWLLND